MAELQLPDASQWVNSFQAGQQAGMVDRRNAAATQAGGMMASGDYAGAAKALYGAGDFQSGSAVANAGFAQSERADKLAREKSVQDKLAAGDLSGAYAAAGTDPDLLKGLGEISSHVAETTNVMASALEALKGPDGQWLPPDQARAKYQAMKPTLLARGIDPQKVNGFDPTPENLQAQEGMVLGLAKQLELHKPDWHQITNADRSTAFKDLNPYNRSQPQAAAAPQQQPQAPTSPVYDQIGQIATQGGASPQEVGYLQRLAQIESSGRPGAQNGASTGLFQFHPDTFASAGGGDIHSVPDQVGAALNLSRRDRQNLQQIGVDPTDANVYLMHQQGAAGGRALLTADPKANAIAVLTPVYGNADVARKAIIRNGGTPDMTAGQFTDMWRQRFQEAPALTGGSGSDSLQGGVGADGIPTVSGSAPQGPEWKPDGKGNLINTRTGDRKVDPSAQAEIPANLQGLTGDALLKAVGPEAETVKALSEGRMAFPTGMALSKPYWQQMLQLVGQYDPTFDQANPQSRVATRRDFTSGKSAQNITALNTVIGHLDHLDRTIDNLGNTGPGGALNFGPLNGVNNYAARMIARESGTDARFKDFETAKTAVANELTRVFRGTGGAEADIQGWMKQLDAASSPEALHSVVRSMATLINSRIQALGEQYAQGMGVSADPIRLLTPDKEQAFQRMIGVKAGGADIPTLTPEQARKLPSGAQFRTTDGRVLTRQ